ncbi:hypothetical protein D3878_14955 [Noviherbaspirillum sedimenti]|uniref:SIR2-like domain-containing protein n=2 Tax=Noviherbaspirillum sedimenti TaxID=2320865 RepID=A0A3A3GQ34_9BURK|nr:hypothetical protein D3878_14955 [Noviherbaspirillum sedimenti]
MKLKALLTRHRADLALLIGNGINRYGARANDNSWDALLTELAQKYLDPVHKKLPDGISMTEFYDVLELACSRGAGEASLQTQFCELMAGWRPQAQHERIVRWAQQHEIPVLTTNFESTLGDAIGCRLQRIPNDKFTAFYPWERYYGTRAGVDPCREFAVWHINGMQCYRQSIRLGLTHYMGAVERARAWLHKGPARLSAGGDMQAWPGAVTWLQVVFHKPLLIFGLALAENEVFLRWLLIERAKYYRKFPERRQAAWYVHGAADKDAGKLYFLKAVGVEPVAAADYDEIYGPATWNQ